MRYSQRELLSEGFWSSFKKPMGALVKGVAKTLDYIHPELTQPIHRADKAMRDIGSSIKAGWQGKEGVIKDAMVDRGFSEETIKIQKIQGSKNYLVIGKLIQDYDTNGQPIVDNRERRIVVDENGNPVSNGRGYSTPTQQNSNQPQTPTNTPPNPLPGTPPPSPTP